MEIRFKLYGGSDAALIARIKEKANGGGENNAARFLLRHWFENERTDISPLGGQQLPPLGGQNQPKQNDDLTAALDDLDAAFNE